MESLTLIYHHAAVTFFTNTCVSALPQLSIHHIDRLFHDDGSLRAIARYRLLITRRDRARVSSPDDAIVQLDRLHIRPIIRSLPALHLILRAERDSKIARSTSYVARFTAVTSRVKCCLAQEPGVRRLHEYPQAGYCSRYYRKAKFCLRENLSRSIVEDQLIARQRLRQTEEAQYCKRDCTESVSISIYSKSDGTRIHQPDCETQDYPDFVTLLHLEPPDQHEWHASNGKVDNASERFDCGPSVELQRASV